MNNRVNPDKVRRAPVASCFFMGLGQILYLKQYLRGIILALFEVVILCCVIFGTKKIIPKDQSAYEYMQSAPDTVEMIDYLEANNWPNLAEIVLARKEKIRTYVQNSVQSWSRSIVRYYKKKDAALGAAVQNHFDDFIPGFFASVDWDDPYAVEDAVFSFVDEVNTAVDDFQSQLADKADDAYADEIDRAGEKFIDRYAAAAAKYDRKLSKATAKTALANGEMKLFDENYDGCAVCKHAAAAGRRTQGHRAFFRGPIVTAIAGLITLGSPQATTVAKYADHSIFMMINGLLCLIVLAIFFITYAFNIKSAKEDAEKIIKFNKFPTLRETRNDISQRSFAVIGITPCIILIAFFTVIPLLFSALVAFTNYSSPDHIPPNSLVDWVGFRNFVTMFSSHGSSGGQWANTFSRVALWTLIWAVLSTTTCFFTGFFFAVILQDKRIKIPELYRTVFILPYAIPQMLSLFIWANLLNGTFGPINRTLIFFKIISQGIPWLSDPMMAKVTLILVNIWIGFPYSMILITSSMTAISNSMYEAAVIDGANKWEQFRSITFPLVMYQLKPILIMQFAGNINNFGAVFFLTAGGPNLPDTISTQAGSTDILISWIFKLTMNTPNMYNIASVLSILVFIVLVPFALYNFMRTKSFKESEI